MNGRDGLTYRPSFPYPPSFLPGWRPARRDRGPRLELVDAIDDHAISGREAGRYRSRIAFDRARRDVSHLDRVIRLHHVNESGFRAALHGGGGNDDGSAQGVDHQPGVDELVGKQLVVLVIENRLALDGARARIDLVVDGQQITRGDLVLHVAVISLDGEPPARSHLLHDLGEVILGNREDHSDGLQLGDDGQAIGVGRMDHVARIHQAQADSAGDWRGDPAVNQLQLRVVDNALVGLNGAFILPHQCGLSVELLLWDGVLRQQDPVTLQVHIGVVEQRHVLRHLALAGLELHLEGPGVDLDQEIALMHDLPLFERHLVDLPIDSRPDCDGIERGNRTQAVEVDVHVALARVGDYDRYGARPALLASCLAAFGLGLAEMGSEEIVRSGSHEAEHQQPEPCAALMRALGFRLIGRHGGRGESRVLGGFDIHLHGSFQGNDYKDRWYCTKA